MLKTRASARAQVLVLLVEADPMARDRHHAAVRAAGWAVIAVAACPDPSEVTLAAVVLSDVASFHWLRESRLGDSMPPTIVVTDDERAGVVACLCGAASWVRSTSNDMSLLEALDSIVDAE